LAHGQQRSFFRLVRPRVILVLNGFRQMNGLASAQQEQRPPPHCGAAWSSVSVVDLVASLGRDAVLVIDDEGRLIHGNATAKEHLESSVLVGLTDGDHVHFVDHAAHQSYQRAFASVALGSHAAALLHLHPELSPVFQVSVCEARSGKKDLFVLRIRNLAEACDARVQNALVCFGLTRAESRVLHATLNGLTPATCAISTGLKISTVRTHLAALFAKTQTNGQAQLIVKVMNLPEF
jgi:DNA-binding CsgD family transcriptional regulator